MKGKKGRVQMRDAEWARKRRRTAPLLLFSYHSTRLNCSSAFVRTLAIRRRGRGGSARGTEKGTRRARTRTRNVHTRTQCTHTHTPGSPSLSRAVPVRAVSVGYVGVSLPLCVLPCARGRERERERKERFIAPFLPAKRSVPRYQCAKQRSRVPLRDWNAG